MMCYSFNTTNIQQVMEGVSVQTSISVFTKPWKDKRGEELAQFVSGMGLNGVEYPVRDGYEVHPGNALEALPELARVLGAHGVRISSVASVTEERVFAACQRAGVPMIRIMLGADRAKGYMASERAWVDQLQALRPLCRRYGVKVGIQPHYGYGISSTMEARHLLERLDPDCFGIIWDAAHSALAGEEPEQALDIAWDYLVLVNLKTAYYRRVSGPEAAHAQFVPYFTTAAHGASDWERIVCELKRRGYEGGLCMPAEYTDEAGVEDYLRADIRELKRLLG